MVKYLEYSAGTLVHGHAIMYSEIDYISYIQATIWLKNVEVPEILNQP